ncbi:hemerythrin domain-containing protein [Gorillibacterium sp. sgz5001074]|uniref:hemerythrin domain-containing protein n=1 Tax=Gorillibacterium sp. sgz5001074 TaxID=3446695 RepID=UPI003F678A0E
MMQTLSREDQTVDTLDVLTSGIDQLKEEHAELKKKMADFYGAAKIMGRDPSVTDWSNAIKSLHTDIVSFMEEMEQHSVWEDQVLFPMVQEYTGKDMGPVAVMEHEHELAKMNVQRFLEKSESLSAAVSPEQAQEAASYLLQAYVILTDHFKKEEEVLFPLAEQMLTDIEQFFSL